MSSYFHIDWPSKWWLVPCFAVGAVMGWASVECFLWVVDWIMQLQISVKG